jgi:hypothetical protein
MTDQQLTAQHILSLSREKKALLLSSMILELTFRARSAFADNGADGASVMRSVEAIHRVCGYMLLLLENEPLDSEAMLAEMAASLVRDDKRMQKALDEL